MKGRKHAGKSSPPSTQHSDSAISSQTGTTAYDNTEDNLNAELTPLQEPHQALNQMLRRITEDDWYVSLKLAEIKKIESVRVLLVL